LADILDPSCPLTDADLAEVRERRARLHHQLHPISPNPILAIHSPWSLVTSKAGKPLAGKTPKKGKDGRKWTDPEQDARQLPSLLKVSAITANTGLVMGGPGGFFGLDIDFSPDKGDDAEHVLDETAEAAGHGEALENATLPVRKRSNDPGRLLAIFRAPEGVSLPILPSISCDWGNIDWLGTGRQAVIDGWHKSAMDGSARIVCVPPLTDCDPLKIPVLTPELLAKMHARALAVCPGAKIVSSETQGNGGARPKSGLNRNFSAEPPVPLAELLVVADALPNTVFGWDSGHWGDTGLRFFAACHGQPYGLLAFAMWSHKIDAIRPDVVHDYVRRWEEMEGCPPDRTGMGALVEAVRKATGNASWTVGDA